MITHKPIEEASRNLGYQILHNKGFIGCGSTHENKILIYVENKEEEYVKQIPQTYDKFEVEIKQMPAFHFL